MERRLMFGANAFGWAYPAQGYIGSLIAGGGRATITAEPRGTARLHATPAGHATITAEPRGTIRLEAR
jgi:hypothetical protein